MYFSISLEKEELLLLRRKRFAGRSELSTRMNLFRVFTLLRFVQLKLILTLLLNNVNKIILKKSFSPTSISIIRSLIFPSHESVTTTPYHFHTLSDTMLTQIFPSKMDVVKYPVVGR
jgi:hypothetical protein